MASDSNRLPVLASEVAALHLEIEGLTLQSAQKALKAGAMLSEAKGLVQHGEWSGWLRSAGLRERTAQRYMQISRSPLNASQVTDLGGVARALSFLSQWVMPQADQALHICLGQGEDENFAFVYGSEVAPGHFDIVALVDEHAIKTKRPMLPLIEVEGAQPVDTIITWLCEQGLLPMTEWKVRAVDLESAKTVIIPTIAFSWMGT